MALEFGAAIIGFVGLAGLLTQGSTFIYDFTKIAEKYSEEMKDIKADIQLTKGVIDCVKKQYYERHTRSPSADTLDIAINNAQRCLSELRNTLQDFQDAKRPSHFERFKFAVKAGQIAKLQQKVQRFKTLMLDVSKLMESDVHANTNQVVHRTQDTMTEVAANVSSTYSDMKYLRSSLDQTTTSLENITQSIAQLTLPTRGTLLPVVSPLPSTAFENSSPGSHSTSRDLAEVMLTPLLIISGALELETFPLLGFQEDTFHLLVACLFSKLCNMKSGKSAYEKATRCLQAYNTPEAMSGATENDLRPYFIDTRGRLTDSKLKQIKTLTEFAKKWTQDPPTPTKLKHKPRQPNFPSSEISHLPGVGFAILDTWICYGKESFYQRAGITLPKDAWQEVKKNGVEKSAKLAAYIIHLENKGSA